MAKTEAPETQRGCAPQRAQRAFKAAKTCSAAFVMGLLVVGGLGYGSWLRNIPPGGVAAHAYRVFEVPAPRAGGG